MEAGDIVVSSSINPPPSASQGVEQTSNPTIAQDNKPKKKICCACPDTKRLRDECVVKHGKDSCEKWIEAHRRCLRGEGFNV